MLEASQKKILVAEAKINGSKANLLNLKKEMLKLAYRR
jgi:hypothetical protein